MKMIKKILTLAIVAVLFAGCLKNDIPYPRIVAKFLSMSAEGEISAAVIDDANSTVTLNLGEEVDVTNVQIIDYTVTEGANLSQDITNGINLSQPLKVTLSLYQDYEWSIECKQNIERYFTVEGKWEKAWLMLVVNALLFMCRRICRFRLLKSPL